MSDETWMTVKITVEELETLIGKHILDLASLPRDYSMVSCIADQEYIQDKLNRIAELNLMRPVRKVKKAANE
jgi:hypothetical protein